MIRTGRKTIEFERAVIFLERKLRKIVRKVYNSFPVLSERNLISPDEILDDTLLDIIQDIERNKFNGKCSLSTYAHKIAKHRCLREKSKLVNINGKYKGLGNFKSSELELVKSEIGLVSKRDVEDNELEILAVLKEGLSETLFTTFKKVVWENKGYTEISKEEDVTVGTLKTRISRAWDIIRNQLGKRIEEIIS